MKTSHYICLLAALLMSLTVSAQKRVQEDLVVVAYVTSWTEEMPDPTVMTHINYAFGHVNDSFDGVRIHNP